MQVFVVKKEDSGQTLIKYIMRLLKEAPSGLIHKQLRNKNITLNDKKALGTEKLAEEDVIKIFMSDETIEKFKGSIIKSTGEYEDAFGKFGNPLIVYEDEHVIFANKPVGILSQKSKPDDVSINEWLIGYLLKKGDITPTGLSKFTPSVCNRLDRNTGGIILFAKTLFGANFLNESLKKRTVHKFYTAIVAGGITKPDHLKGYLVKNEAKNIVSVSETPSDNAEFIETKYKPVRYSAKNNMTELRVELLTGKAHQIRAHLASIKHPIIGDSKYGDASVNAKAMGILKLKGQFLYATELIFDINDSYPELSGKTFNINISDMSDLFFKD